MQNSTPIQHLSLCAIVRDEITNPAGGIRDFLIKTLPYVGEAIIVDTGSVDGTRQVLSAAQRMYPHLKVADYEFRGFADVRNHSLSLATKEFILVLDADERMMPESFGQLNDLLVPGKGTSYGLNFRTYRNGVEQPDGFGANPRVFQNDPDIRYQLPYRELISFLSCPLYGYTPFYRELPIDIHHFMPSEAASKRKEDELYHPIQQGESVQPSSLPSFKEWKQKGIDG